MMKGDMKEGMNGLRLHAQSTPMAISRPSVVFLNVGLFFLFICNLRLIIFNLFLASQMTF